MCVNERVHVGRMENARSECVCEKMLYNANELMRERVEERKREFLNAE